MATQNRKLAALISADVVGYTRLMQTDEPGTHSRLRSRFREIIEPCLAEYDGRVVKLMGDGLLAEFPSIVNAINWAVSIQCALASAGEREASQPRLEYRVGVHLGDVIVDDDDLFGDGVNLATRLQEVADPGGICISDAVYQQIQGKIDETFVDGGKASLKNVDRDMQIWRWPPSPVMERSLVDISQPVPGFDGRPAIAVLAFTNMSRDPEQEFLADGISADILTRLAMWRWLPVIARSSSFVYKGQAIDVKTVGQALGARYVLEGSIQQSGDRVRVAGQLIDAETGRHVWAGRYDRDMVDIFALQDEITEAIVAALEPAVGRAEMLRAQRKMPTDLDAWGLYQRGVSQLTLATRESLDTARRLFHRSAQVDPAFARPFAGIAIIDFIENTIGYSSDAKISSEEARDRAIHAVALDDLEPFAHVALAYASFMHGNHDAAVMAGRRAIELNPSFALGYHALAAALFTSGDQDNAIESVLTAIRISPNDPFLFLFLGALSASRYMKHDYAGAAEAAALGVRRFPWYASVHRWHALALAQLDRAEDAANALAEFLRHSPNFDLVVAERSYTFRRRSDLNHYLDGFIKAGLVR